MKKIHGFLVLITLILAGCLVDNGENSITANGNSRNTLGVCPNDTIKVDLTDTTIKYIVPKNANDTTIIYGTDTLDIIIKNSCNEVSVVTASSSSIVVSSFMTSSSSDVPVMTSSSSIAVSSVVPSSSNIASSSIASSSSSVVPVVTSSSSIAVSSSVASSSSIAVSSSADAIELPDMLYNMMSIMGGFKSEDYPVNGKYRLYTQATANKTSLTYTIIGIERKMYLYYGVNTPMTECTSNINNTLPTSEGTIESAFNSSTSVFWANKDVYEYECTNGYRANRLVTTMYIEVLGVLYYKTWTKVIMGDLSNMVGIVDIINNYGY